ncbi:hypothetical protein FJW07_13975 [Mesorhizobium sp. B3-1-9]|uniref:hypothetical protein n=1 Tax=unclassified Mesorhizobium TaxID=325217 RepID=UPI00112EC044|nr:MULTISPECIES: hypothetical protein [unclassified Mesorhizobium]TPI39284.1 hypothetical protein FJW07_13975 [Mesorhizobium sp. B3-1-9]UCI23713.1 hypothetical protein FJ430_19045 [Mesorhizobium sp. B2-8-5]
MPQPEPPSFHLRIPPALKAQLEAARGRNSLNREIIERLERSFSLDPAVRLAEIFRPFLVAVDDNQREKLMELAEAALAIVAAKPSSKRRPPET